MFRMQPRVLPTQQSTHVRKGDGTNGEMLELVLAPGAGHGRGKGKGGGERRV